MTRLTIALLGPPRVERDGEPIDVDTRKAIALLAYLAVTGQRHSRDVLATLFWAEADQSHARAALRRTLSALNSAIGEGWLEIERDALALCLARDVVLDVAEFRRLTATSTQRVDLDALARAAALYRGDFMAGFALRDSAEFDDWQFFQAESLRRELSTALERLALGYGARRDWDAAIEQARRWLALDALHEPAHRLLMRAYAAAGQRATALRQYRECVRVLDRELGVAPVEETTALYQAIMENQLPAAAPLPSTVRRPPDIAERRAPARARELPLVGRDQELAAALAAYRRVGPGGHLLVIEGEAGIGKTRLAEEALDRLAVGGARVIAGQAYQGEMQLALGPFVDGLRASLAEPEAGQRLDRLPPHVLAELARLLPELATGASAYPPTPLDSPSARTRFFEAVLQGLLALSAGATPGILFLDDAQWADDASLDLLAYIVRRTTDRPLLTLVTWRGEQVPVEHRLRTLLVEAESARRATLVSLKRLGREAVQELVRAADVTQAGMDDRLYQETEGLPFFVVEYLTALSEGGITAGGDWSAPRGVRRLLQSRLAAVSDTGRQVLTAAAVIGRSFDLDAVQAASGRGEDETVVALEELDSAGLILEVRRAPGAEPLAQPGAPTYDFSHEQLRALVYEEASLARRRLLHRRVAEALLARERHRPELVAAQVAHHYRLAGQDASAARYARLAGEHAQALFANAEALAHYQTALALGHPDAAALRAAIGDLHTLRGEYDAALASYEAAAALSPPEAVASVEHKLGLLYDRLGEWELAERYFQSALTGFPPASAEQRPRLLVDWSRAVHHAGQAARALDLGEQALELARAADDDRVLAHAHNLLGVLARARGDLPAARRHLEDSLELAERLNDTTARAAALNNLALLAFTEGNTALAREHAEAALALCIVQGDRHREAALRSHLADFMHSSGQHSDALAQLAQSATIFAEIGIVAGEMQAEVWKLVDW
jgi:predicted ATPase/DNA-binding SARP family transcriptional activator